MDNEIQLRNIIQELTGFDLTDVDSSTYLVEAIALDSIDGLRVIAGIERTMNITFPDGTLGKLRSIEAILKVIDEVQQ
ncbi:MAG: acyl carrier protein [Sedimenticola sp.]